MVPGRRGHLILGSNLDFAAVYYVAGPCAGQIVDFNVGQATLASGERLGFPQEGGIRVYSTMPVEPRNSPVEMIASLPDYRVIMAERVVAAANPDGATLPYIGLLKSSTDYVIARFDLLNGKASKAAELLIRSRSPIVSVSYLPSPDSPQGRIGFVQQSGVNKVRLYLYDWRHGKLPELR